MYGTDKNYDQEYEKILMLVHNGSTITEAVECLGIHRKNFFNRLTKVQKSDLQKAKKESNVQVNT